MKINTIYETISGEIGKFPQGAYCTIVRMQGCNLRCVYCDTKQSWNENSYTEMSPEEVLKNIHTKNVLITGGEPLYQREELKKLLKLLDESNHVIQVETNGACQITDRTLEDEHTNWVVDYKGISSGENDSMGSNKEFVSRVFPAKYIKFVVADEDEVHKAFDVIKEYKTYIQSKFALWKDVFNKKTFAFSPMDGNPKLVKMIINECHKDEDINTLLCNGNIVISVQLHKLVEMA